MPRLAMVKNRVGRASVSDKSILNDLGNSFGKCSGKEKAPTRKVSTAGDTSSTILLTGKRGHVEKPEVERLPNTPPSFDGSSGNAAPARGRVSRELIGISN